MADKGTENIISGSLADKLIAAHDGDMALYCLYAARHPGEDDETAAAVLCRTRAEIAAAREKLGRILRAESGEGEKAVYPEEKPEQYPKEDIVRTAARKKEFAALCDELAHILGTIPSQAYLNMLLDVYDHLGMPPEVILLLLHYCEEEARRRWGSTRRPSAKFISDEAYAWARREVMTLELAEEYIARRAKLREEKTRVAALLGIRGRELSPTETKYVEAWLEMGFTDEALEDAYDRTLTKTGSLKWPYMNSILRKWHEAGLHDEAAIEKAEGKGRKTVDDPAAEADPRDLERILNKLKGGKS
jgi:hypothetical protein